MTYIKDNTFKLPFNHKVLGTAKKPDGRSYVFVENTDTGAYHPYVTYSVDCCDPLSLFSGHYFADHDAAVSDFHKRVG